MNMDLLEQIENIELKIKLLALKLERIQKENASLKKNKQTLQRQLAEKDAAILKLQTELKAKAGGKEQMKNINPEQIKQLKKQIDQYIEDLEKCIDWLKNN